MIINFNIYEIMINLGGQMIGVKNYPKDKFATSFI